MDRRARQLESLTKMLVSIQGPAEDLDQLLALLLREVCAWLETPSSALFQLDGEEGWQFRLGVGELATAEASSELIRGFERARPYEDGAIVTVDGSTLLPLEGFGLVLALAPHALTPDRRYVLTVFLKHASLAISKNRIQQRLARAERTAAVGQAVASLMHDLRGPIGNASMLLDLLEMGTPLPWSQPETITRVRALLDVSFAMMQDVLDYTRGAVAADRAPVKLARALSSDLEIWEVMMSMQQVELDVDVPEDLVAEVDTKLLGRAVWNLIRNASEAALQGTGAARVCLAACREGDEVVIRIHDTGPGISPEIASHLFQAGSTHGKKGGVGFGLAVVKHVAEAHQGSVCVERTGPEGTVMALRLG